MSATTCPEPNLPPATDAGTAEIRFTDSCRPCVRTPDERFADLPDWPFEPRYTTVDGLRVHYVDEGPSDGEVVVLLHGQPTWGYLYRKMIPVLSAAGHRVVVPDLVGTGRSDKPVQIEDYRFLQHVSWFEGFLDALDLRDITIFVQDWGSLIGLRAVGNDPDRYARVVVANGQLPVVPEGFELLQLPDELEPDDDMVLPFADPGLQGLSWAEQFQRWAVFSLVGTKFRASDVVDSGTATSLSPEELAAYDAPFPSRIHMAGVRAFPSLVNTLGEAPTNEAAQAALDAFERPALTLFGRLDKGLGTDAVQSLIRDRVPGAAGLDHHAYDDASHFIQEDKGDDLARRVDELIRSTPPT
ncbi:MAG TPA: haloalkane dehalogenase [Acidimicrobiales bacterium]|nr:haloalkane dehalogenase [Acidimicrobiales bacterium]